MKPEETEQIISHFQGSVLLCINKAHLIILKANIICGLKYLVSTMVSILLVLPYLIFTLVLWGDELQEFKYELPQGHTQLRGAA